MKIRTNYKLTFATTVLLMAASQLNLVQAADYPYSNQAAPPAYNPSYSECLTPNARRILRNSYFPD